MSKLKTRDVIYWVSVIGPLVDCAIGFVKGIVTVIKSGALVDEYRIARDERIQREVDAYVNEVRKKMDADFSDPVKSDVNGLVKYFVKEMEKQQDEF